MPLDNPAGGSSYAAEFQSSALPWATSSVAPAVGSPVRIDFPKVTRFIQVSNLNTGSSSMSFGFTYAGVTSSSNKYILNAGQSVLLELRTKSLWLQGESGTPSYSMVAGLTMVNVRDFPNLTGSAADGTFWPGVG